MSLPKKYKFAETEKRLQESWDEMGLYTFDPNHEGETTDIDPIKLLDEIAEMIPEDHPAKTIIHALATFPIAGTTDTIGLVGSIYLEDTDYEKAFYQRLIETD